MHTTQMLLANGREDWDSIRWRAAMNVLALALCIPLGKVIAATLDRRLSQRVLAICFENAIKHGVARTFAPVQLTLSAAMSSWD
ncbi:MAG: hypothetical protein ACREXP_11280 [Steroidobacteraceae bacterium]